MKISKILLIGLALLAVACTFTAISAENVQANTIQIENGTLTLNDIQFKIPEGFMQVESDQDNSEIGDAEHIEGTTVDKEVSAEFANSKGEKLDIKIGSNTNSKIETINLPNAEQRNIAGKDGYFWTEVDDGINEYNFEYLEDGKIIKIKTNNEDVISQVLS